MKLYVPLDIVKTFAGYVWIYIAQHITQLSYIFHEFCDSSVSVGWNMIKRYIHLDIGKYGLDADKIIVHRHRHVYRSTGGTGILHSLRFLY